MRLVTFCSSTGCCWSTRERRMSVQCLRIYKALALSAQSMNAQT